MRRPRHVHVVGQDGQRLRRRRGDEVAGGDRGRREPAPVVSHGRGGAETRAIHDRDLDLVVVKVLLVVVVLFGDRIGGSN